MNTQPWTATQVGDLDHRIRLNEAEAEAMVAALAARDDAGSEYFRLCEHLRDLESRRLRRIVSGLVVFFPDHARELVGRMETWRSVLADDPQFAESCALEQTEMRQDAAWLRGRIEAANQARGSDA